jgi:hypothetical protein
MVLGTPGDPPGLLMNVVAGTSRADPDEIEVVAPEYLSLIADVHRVDPTLFPIDQYPSMTEAVSADLVWWNEYAAECGALEEPLVRLGARVLQAKLPVTDEEPSLVHGDAGAGNFMVAGGRVSGILDWELAHVGDPHEDIAWMWMRGAHTSFGDPRLRMTQYEAAGGRRLDPERMQWYLALVMWKSCIGMYADRHRPPSPSSFVQSIVTLTYGALLGAQLVRLLGGALGLLEQNPVVQVTPAVPPTDWVLSSSDLSKEARLVMSYLRAVCAQSEWERDAFYRDMRSFGLAADLRLVDVITDIPEEDLLTVATVLARAADRAAMALPNAVRRIERAQRIGLGTINETTKGTV